MRQRLFVPIPLLNGKMCITEVDNIDLVTDQFDHKDAAIKTLFALKSGKKVYSIMELQTYFNGLFGNNQPPQQAPAPQQTPPSSPEIAPTAASENKEDVLDGA